MSIHESVKIHSSAIVDLGAKIGANTTIWHWSHICSGAQIDEKCTFGQNVYVGNNVKIAKNVKVQNNVSIYDNVFIEENVFCGPSMVFTNVYNPRSEVSRKSEYKNTYVRKGATLGANCTIVCGNTIGEYSFIGAGAVITKDTKPYSLMAGVPAKQIGWISKYGEKINLPINGKGTWTCPHMNEKYVLKNNMLYLVDN